MLCTIGTLWLPGCFPVSHHVLACLAGLLPLPGDSFAFQQKSQKTSENQPVSNQSTRPNVSMFPSGRSMRLTPNAADVKRSSFTGKWHVKPNSWQLLKTCWNRDSRCFIVTINFVFSWIGKTGNTKTTMFKWLKRFWHLWQDQPDCRFQVGKSDSAPWTSSREAHSLSVQTSVRPWVFHWATWRPGKIL